MSIAGQSRPTDHLFLEVSEHLCQQIRTGQLKAEERLPGLRALAKERRVSRSTVRRAIKLLEHEGILRALAGAGTFVTAEARQRVMERHLRRVEWAIDRLIHTATASGLPVSSLPEVVGSRVDEMR